MSESYGTIRAELQRHCVLFGQNDRWIAGHTMLAKAILLTAAIGEFDRLDGLALENWIEDDSTR